MALRSFVNDESGATVIEYGLIIAFIAVAILGALTAMGTASGDSWAASWGKIDAAL